MDFNQELKYHLKEINSTVLRDTLTAQGYTVIE